MGVPTADIFKKDISDGSRLSRKAVRDAQDRSHRQLRAADGAAEAGSSHRKKKSTNRSRDLEAELHKHFERKRLPQSEWFSLSPLQVEQCLKCMGANRVKRLKSKTSIAARKAKRATSEELAEYRKLAGLSEDDS